MIKKRKWGKGVPYLGGMILGKIPRNILDSLEVKDGGDIVVSHSSQASLFLKRNDFHKVMS